MKLILALSLLTEVLLSQTPKILVHGHRGARAVRPENTMPAFEYAIAAGVDVLELDLAVTKDDILVVSHDPLLNEEICTGPAGPSRAIQGLTYAEIQKWDCGAKKNPAFPQQRPVPGTRMPKLDDVLALASKGTFEFNIETKIFADKPDLSPSPPKFARLLYDAIRKHKLESRVIVQSFDFRTLVEMKKLDPSIRLSALLANPWSWLAAAKESGARIVSPHYLLVTASRVAEAHRAGLQVVPWTANDESTWKRLVAAKVDGIISDDPAALIAWLKPKGLR